MSEIRDKAKRQIVNLIRAHLCFSPEDANIYADKILSIPEIAIVDREAELPKLVEIPLDESYNAGFHDGYLMGQKGMLRGGWTKEIEDDSTKSNS